ncbi:MAG: acyltransferase family protein [Prevotella sp.]|nr:acyltransferase family protein [Prevotella sp.]
MNLDGKRNGARVGEIDFIKCVMILLMIAFHIVYIGDTYPAAKRLVYTFHMPAFLLISGYLMNVGKQPRQFLRSMLWLFVPYVVMELAYTLMAAVLPIREHIDQLTVGVVVRNLLLTPIGPYWYLHTLLLCGLCYYVVASLPRLYPPIKAALLAVIYALLGEAFGLLSTSCAFYFLAGAVVRQSGHTLLGVIRPSLWAALPLVVLAFFPSQHDKAMPGGIAIVWCAMSLSAAFYALLKDGMVRDGALLIGRHTLLLLLFSPIFTALARLYQPLLVGRLDPSGIVFLSVTLLLAVGGSLLIGLLLDVLGLSRWLFGRRCLLSAGVS